MKTYYITYLVYSECEAGVVKLFARAWPYFLIRRFCPLYPRCRQQRVVPRLPHFQSGVEGGEGVTWCGGIAPSLQLYNVITLFKRIHCLICKNNYQFPFFAFLLFLVIFFTNSKFKIVYTKRFSKSYVLLFCFIKTADILLEFYLKAFHKIFDKLRAMSAILTNYFFSLKKSFTWNLLVVNSRNRPNIWRH